MAVINLREVDESLSAALKSRAALAGIGFHDYCKKVLHEHIADENTIDQMSFGQKGVMPIEPKNKGRSSKPEPPSVERVPDQAEDKRAAAVQAVSSIGEEIKPAAELQRPEDICPVCGTKMLDYGSTLRCAKCARNFPK